MVDNQRVKVGEVISCKDPDDMIEVMNNLARQGIKTDMMYELDGKEGYFVVITGLDLFGYGYNPYQE